MAKVRPGPQTPSRTCRRSRRPAPDIATFLNKLQNTSGLNVNTELAKLQQTLQKDFDAGLALTVRTT